MANPRLSETPCELSQGVLRHQHRFGRLPGGNRLLVWIGKTCGPTRFNSGDTEAAQEALRTRMFSGRLRCQLALARRQTPAGLLIAVTFPPHTLLLASASFFDLGFCKG